MPKISYTDPNGVRREVVFHDRLRLGRHPSQDVQILDRVISKEHAVFEVRGVEAVIFDVGSRNGTSLNGELISGAVVLKNGDEVTLGGTTVTFHADDEDDQPAEAPLDATRAVSGSAVSDAAPAGGRSDAKHTRVTILDEGIDSAIRKRLRNTGLSHFPKAELVDDVNQLRQDYEKLRIANELNQAVSLEFDLERLLNRILEKAFEMFAADRGVIMLMDLETQELQPGATRVRHADVSGAGNIRISKTILREVIDERTSVLSSDAQMDSRFGGAQSIIMQGIKATMSVPLMYRDKMLGIIHLDSQLAAGAFTEKDLQLLTGFANQAANAIEHSRLVDRTKNEALAREQLGRLLPQDVVDDVMNGRLQIKRGGSTRLASTMFADIRGFTAMSERYPAEAIVEMLNQYFEVMVEVVFQHGGTLDKFIGDEIMAVWGAPIQLDDHCARAVLAGLDMQAAVESLNAERQQKGHEPINVGIGINTGEMVAGYMGSSRAMDYTVVGDAVNTASRLCSAAKAGQVIVSEHVIALVEDLVAYEELPAQNLKGKKAKVPLFRVLRRL